MPPAGELTFTSTSSYTWELACGLLLVTEAGGMITDWEGKSLKIGQDSVIASNKAVHADFLRIVREIIH